MKYALFISIFFLSACESESKPTTATTNSAVVSADHVPTEKPAAVVPEAPKFDGVVSFDFVDNRHLAHNYDDGLLIDFGTAGSLKYIQGSWNSPWYEGTKDATFSYVYPKGVGASLRFPLIAPGVTGLTDDSWTAVFRLKPVGKQKADIFFRASNGEEKKIGSINEIAEGWGTYSVKIPAGYTIGQEHMLRVHFAHSQPIDGGRKSAAAIDWIRIGKGSTDKEPARIATAFDPAKKSITLAPGQRFFWYTMPGKGQSFAAKVEGTPSLEVTPYDGTTVSGKAEAGAIQMDFAKFAGKPVRIEFVNSSSAPAVFLNPALRSVQAEKIARAPGPKYVLVWLVDTLRADHVPLYNPKTDVEMPNLVEFAKTADVFQSGTVQGNSSLPTSASIFSAAYSPNHGMITEKAKLPADHTTFGEAFKKGGWATALFSSNGYVSNSWGFARGFDLEVNPIRENRPSDTEYLWPEAETWLKKQVTENPGKPALLYINTVDPHVPYDPPADVLAKYHQGGAVGKVSPRGTGQLLHDMAGGKISLNAAEAKYMHALYQGEITYNDIWFGKMLASLDAMGIRDQTMIVVTSDHGEEFGEYGKFGHGISVNQELVDVPFLISYRPWTKQGRVVSQDVEVVDILPTVLDAAGIEKPKSLQGASLVDLMLDPTELHPRAAFSYHNTFLRGARVGDWKYQLFNGDNDPLFYLPDGKDGADKNDISESKPLVRRMMRDSMAFQVGLDKVIDKSKHGTANNHSAELAKMLDSKGW